jgi:hypothetical protein
LRNPELGNVGEAATYGLAGKVPDTRFLKNFMALYIEQVLEIK